MSLSDTVRGQQLCRGAHLQGWVYDHTMGGKSRLHARKWAAAQQENMLLSPETGGVSDQEQ